VTDTLPLLAIAFVDTNTGVAVGNYGRIFRSTNGGIDWKRCAVVTQSHLNGLRFAGRDSGWAVGNNGTILKTTDGGKQWSVDISGTLVSLSAVAAVDVHTQWIVGDRGTVLKTGGDPTTIAYGPSTGLPQQCELLQNYPNPFNPGTTITYRVLSPGPRQVRLVVYDLLGREVAVLVDGQDHVGEHTVSFDGRRLASGMYIYRLQVAGEIRTHKMLLTK
jgi:hypothetical protein